MEALPQGNVIIIIIIENIVSFTALIYTEIIFQQTSAATRW
jgi:hypothetical protein